MEINADTDAEINAGIEADTDAEINVQINADINCRNGYRYIFGTDVNSFRKYNTNVN